ncbi:ketosteroid isomerase-like protein [Brevundimonas vesicularis]|uniref:Ketosteroid isomerase-like protein n=1 Tax=Brevundimonas vesicularis TaxID=41276 RepID=A0A7W9L5Z5_BREVE|nr:nuclear transport factor 2 family protein [Brevundimonas vesicularis]MBB5771912.1 ketosteroid isomerase-like protein [Brevundimonas vesicularis]
MLSQAPAPIGAYFDAIERGRVEDVAAVFSPDGEVRDERVAHRGREAISAWAADTLERYKMRNTLLSERVEGGRHVVVARVTGAFPGSPLDFTYRFTLGADGVAVLEISL